MRSGCDTTTPCALQIAEERTAGLASRPGALYSNDQQARGGGAQSKKTSARGRLATPTIGGVGGGRARTSPPPTAFFSMPRRVFPRARSAIGRVFGPFPPEFGFFSLCAARVLCRAVRTAVRRTAQWNYKHFQGNTQRECALQVAVLAFGQFAGLPQGSAAHAAQCGARVGK